MGFDRTMAGNLTQGYTPEAKAEIIEHVVSEMSAGRALSRVLAEDEGMPSASTFWRWHLEDEDLQDKVARAREAGVEAIMQEVVEIADNANGDVYIEQTERGPRARIDGEAISRSKLRVETRFKYAQMVAPRKYGVKVDVTSGNEPLPAPQTPVLVDARMQSLIAIALQRTAEPEPPAIEDLMS